MSKLSNSTPQAGDFTRQEFKTKIREALKKSFFLRTTFTDIAHTILVDEAGPQLMQYYVPRTPFAVLPFTWGQATERERNEAYCQVACELFKLCVDDRVMRSEYVKEPKPAALFSTVDDERYLDEEAARFDYEIAVEAWPYWPRDGGE